MNGDRCLWQSEARASALQKHLKILVVSNVDFATERTRELWEDNLPKFAESGIQYTILFLVYRGSVGEFAVSSRNMQVIEEEALKDGRACKAELWQRVKTRLDEDATTTHVWLIDEDMSFATFEFNAFFDVVRTLDPLVCQPSIAPFAKGQRSTDVKELRHDTRKQLHLIAQEVSRSEVQVPLISAKIWPAIHEKLHRMNGLSIWGIDTFWDAVACAAYAQNDLYHRPLLIYCAVVHKDFRSMNNTRCVRGCLGNNCQIDESAVYDAVKTLKLANTNQKPNEWLKNAELIAKTNPKRRYFMCDVSGQIELPAYIGEFGAEIDRAIPHAYALYKNGKLRKVHYMQGMEAFYETIFPPEYLVKCESKPRTFNPQRNYWYSLFKGNVHCDCDFPWHAPPYKEEVKELYRDRVAMLQSLAQGKPFVIIHNKYTSEWGSEPINFLTLQTVKTLYSLLEAKKLFPVVIHPRPSGQLQGFTRDHQEDRSTSPLKSHFDYEQNAIRTMDAIMKKLEWKDYNKTQLCLHACSERFVSIQGGTSRLASLFGGTNIVLHKAGGELQHNEYKKVISKMSTDLKLIVVHSEEDILMQSETIL